VPALAVGAGDQAASKKRPAGAVSTANGEGNCHDRGAIGQCAMAKGLAEAFNSAEEHSPTIIATTPAANVAWQQRAEAKRKCDAPHTGQMGGGGRRAARSRVIAGRYGGRRAMVMSVPEVCVRAICGAGCPMRLRALRAMPRFRHKGASAVCGGQEGQAKCLRHTGISAAMAAALGHLVLRHAQPITRSGQHNGCGWPWRPLLRGIGLS